ncbi:MAG: hypothetical protein LBQ63_05650 [Deltaproteobacteria bacterium]|jgi:hypothetical protein|nr:hypothetical protein [Deltaproteobacteria bacterium]
MALSPYHQGHLDFFCAVYALINALKLTHGLRLEQAREILGGTLSEVSERPPLWSAFLRNRTDYYWLVDYILGRFCREGALALRMAKLPPLPPLSAPESFEGKEALSGLRLESPPCLSLEKLDEKDLFHQGAEFESSGPVPPRRSPDWRMESLWPFLRSWLPERRFPGPSPDEGAQGRCLLLRFHRFLPFQKFPLISHWSTGRFFFRETLQLYDCTQNKEGIHRLLPRECALYPEHLGQGRLLGLEPESIYFLEKA